MVCKSKERKYKILKEKKRRIEEEKKRRRIGKGDDKVDIPLLNKEDVEKEGEYIGVPIGASIRDDIIDFLMSKGYRYAPSEEYIGEETNDFFIKDDQMVQVIIGNEIPDEILGLITNEESRK